VAAELGLRGWVRNLPDGRVEAVFEGARPACEKALAFVRKGPPSARVSRVVEEWGEKEEALDEFELRF
jgi:acylphosphatase